LKTLLVAIGNPYRRDDGVARLVVQSLRLPPEAQAEICVQLTPELAADMAKFERTIFVDADAVGTEARLEPLKESSVQPSPIGHALTPEEVTLMARRLYDYRGEVWLCRVPGEDFSDGEGLSARAAANARAAVALLRGLTGYAALPGPDRRKEPRLLCADLVSVSWTDRDGMNRQEVANLEDISDHGVCLQFEQAVPAGTQVFIQAGEAHLEGVVRYCREELFGWFCGVELVPGSEWPKETFQPRHLLDPASLAKNRKP
jgi:hydrogenase maturation protease